jgi:hydrogenase/urease accessory protein HupE
VRTLLALVLALAWPAGAAAHRLAPSFLSLDATSAQDVAPTGADLVELVWRTPRVRVAGADPRYAIPDGCSADGPVRVLDTPSARVERRSLRCPRGLVGTELRVEGLAESATDALVHVTLADGRRIRALLTADAPTLRVPAHESRLRVLHRYGRLGMEHLLGGLDHLLFVAGLVVLVGGGRRLLAAVTAFTAGHTVTLAVAALGAVRLPAAWVEVGIAASLVGLGLEVARHGPGAPAGRGRLAGRPAAVAFGFGLLHGLGFAGALGSLGMPAASIPLALLGFNAGLEAGQLLWIAACLPGVVLLRRASAARPRWAREIPATAIGSLGVYWILERTLGG